MALGCLVKCRRSFPVEWRSGADGTNQSEASACGKSGKLYPSQAKGSSIVEKPFLLQFANRLARPSLLVLACMVHLPFLLRIKENHLIQKATGMASIAVDR